MNQFCAQHSLDKELCRIKNHFHEKRQAVPPTWDSVYYELGSITSLMRFVAFILFSALVGTGCSTSRTPSFRAATRHDDIVEAVFRHIAQPAPVVDEDSHGVNLVHKVYFLAVENSQDPSPELLHRFDDFKVPVKPMSASVRRDFDIFDRLTGERGAAFYIHSIRNLGVNTVEVQADTNPGGAMRGSGFIYRVICNHGKWSVTGQKLKWIS